MSRIGTTQSATLGAALLPTLRMVQEIDHWMARIRAMDSLTLRSTADATASELDDLEADHG